MKLKRIDTYTDMEADTRLPSAYGVADTPGLAYGTDKHGSAVPAGDTGADWIVRRNAVGLRQAFLIAEAWELSQAALGTLLGTVPRNLQRWRQQVEAGEGLNLSADTVERLSYLLGIWKALGILLPTPANRLLWLRNANTDAPFNGQAPLARLLAGQVADLYVVRHYLDGARS